MSWAAVGWVVGALVVVLLTVLVCDKATRRRVVRSVARRWERRSQRTSQARARAHVRSTRAASSRSQQARPRFERPKQPRLGAKRCSAACRTSRKPAFDPKTGALLCDCPCGGREHGVYRKGSTATPKAPRRAAGSSGTQRVAAPPSSKPSTRALPRVPTMTGPVKRATTGTLDTPKPAAPPPVRTVSPTTPPAPAPSPKWNALQASSWEAMTRHAEQNPRCAGGTFSAETFRDWRTDPPKVSQSIKCDTCSGRLT